MRRRIDLGQKVTGKEEARMEQKRQRWTARNKHRPEHENPFLSAIKPDNENYGEPGERYDELRVRLENLEFGNFPGYFNYRNSATQLAKSETPKPNEIPHETTGSTIPKGSHDQDSQEKSKHLPREADKFKGEHSDEKNVDVDIDKKKFEPNREGEEATSPLESGLSDERLRLMKREWFHGKDVLDIGCNRGHITYAIAKKFEPNLIMGIDIDIKMINMANRDLHLHLENDLLKRSCDFRLERAAKLRLQEDGTICDATSYTEDPNHFPLSSYISQGPLAISSMEADRNNPNTSNASSTVDQIEINTQSAGDHIGRDTDLLESLSSSSVEQDNKESSKSSVEHQKERPSNTTMAHQSSCGEQQQQQQGQQQRQGQELNLFPNNIVFVEHNYVLARDDLVEKQRAYFDTIVCLSVTKWIHLNYRDDGLKRFFKRIYKHLKPNGGLLILEAQPYDNYGRRKKMSDRLRANYYDIKFKPDQFDAYLLSDQVGFRQILDSNTTDHECAGFKRPMRVYLK